MAFSLITLDQERYLRSLIGQPDDRTATKALQDLCERMRRGAILTDSSRIRASVKLCLYRPSANLKRWAINTLARIGVAQDVPSIMLVWRDHSDDPDMLGAVVAAVYALSDEEGAALSLQNAGIALEGVALVSASQYSLVQKRKLVETLIPLERADAAQLKSGIVLAGTGKAPEHLFDRKYTNAIALGQLNGHDVPSVSKYSIWALAELGLGFGALSIPLSDLESSPAEVRKWMYRLLFQDYHALRKELDLIKFVAGDVESEVREEAAIALRDTYVLGMERFVLTWCFSEPHSETRLRLIEHMASQSDKSNDYRNAVVELYTNELVRSDRRGRIEAAAAKTALYAQLRKIDIGQEMGTMFANDNQLFGGKTVTIEQNFHNNNIGAVTGSGDIVAHTMQAVDAVENEQVRQLLEAILAELQQNPSTKESQEVARDVQEVAKAPSKPLLERLAASLGSLKSATSSAGSIFKNVDVLIDQAGNVVDAF